MFEYAVGHWFQKAAEHVFGCVLCSPGCFALFRGTAVAEAMETYSSVPESAMDYLQHDQGRIHLLRPPASSFLRLQVKTDGCAHCFCKTVGELNIAQLLMP